MCQPLPYADFRWVDDVDNFDVTTIATDLPMDYLLKVNLEYSQHLHNAHSDLPFYPTREKPPGKREDKLLATSYNKKRYIIYYRSSVLAMASVSQKFTVFAQSPWLRNIILNSREQQILKKFTNLWTNFRQNHEECAIRDTLGWTVWRGSNDPNFHSRKVFSENLVVIEIQKLEVKFNKPIYIYGYVHPRYIQDVFIRILSRAVFIISNATIYMILWNINTIIWSTILTTFR